MVIIVVSKGKTLTWLDDCRIPYQSEQDKENVRNTNKNFVGTKVKPPEWGWHDNKMIRRFVEHKGRFPANLLVQNDVLNDSFSEYSRYFDLDKWYKEYFNL